MQDTVEITKAAYSDWIDLKTIMLTALKEDPLAFSVDHEDYAKNSDEWWKSYLSSFLFQMNAEMYLAKINNKLAGITGVIYESKSRRSHIASIVWVFVLKEYRRKGIAKQLMSKVLTEIELRPAVSKISLLMNAPQKEAMAMYENFGFKKVGHMEKEIKINGEFYDEYIFEKFIR